MRELELLRRARTREAARPLGLSPFEERLFSAHVTTAQHAAEMHRLPVDSGSYQPLQAENGAFYYMNDYSIIDGDDLIQ